MSPTELKMQPTIHLECKAGYDTYSALPAKCIVGYIFNSIRLIIIRELPEKYFLKISYRVKFFLVWCISNYKGDLMSIVFVLRISRAIVQGSYEFFVDIKKNSITIK
jgi:hypothetical protein